jgi:RNA polymerase primary sigma factor
MGIIKRREVLTREEELELFRKARDPEGTPESRAAAEETLVLKNMGLVVKEARRFACNEAVPQDDLIQEGARGLVRAIRKFDPAMGKKFSTYATYWVKRDVGRLVRTSSDVIHVPEHTSEAARIAKAAAARFEAENGRAPTAAEFEKASGMSAAKAAEAIAACRRTASIHAPVGEDGTEMGDLVEDEKSPRPDDEMARADGRLVLRRALNALPPAERAVLALRFGVHEPMTKAGFAEAFGVREAAL